MRATMSLLAIILVSSFLPAALADTVARTGTWKEVENSDGIRVFRLEVPGRDLPGFRGETVIASDVEAIVAVLKRVDEYTQWIHQCTASRTIESFTPEHMLVYMRTRAPWPVWDRDVILDSQFTRDASQNLVVLTFENTAATRLPVPERVVRMPRVKGFYRMRQEAPRKTRVVYQLESDIGGGVPRFLAQRIARDIPYETLRRLRARATSAPGPRSEVAQQGAPR